MKIAVLINNDQEFHNLFIKTSISFWVKLEERIFNDTPLDQLQSFP